MLIRAVSWHHTSHCKIDTLYPVIMHGMAEFCISHFCYVYVVTPTLRTAEVCVNCSCSLSLQGVSGQIAFFIRVQYTGGGICNEYDHKIDIQQVLDLCFTMISVFTQLYCYCNPKQYYLYSFTADDVCLFWILHVILSTIAGITQLTKVLQHACKLLLQYIHSFSSCNGNI